MKTKSNNTHTLSLSLSRSFSSALCTWYYRQPFSSPSCTVDRKTSGVPPPMASQDINGLSKPHSRPTQHKNQTAKQHSVMTRSSPSSKTSTLLGSSSSPSALELHYQLYGRSSYRLSFGRPRFAKVLFFSPSPLPPLCNFVCVCVCVSLSLSLSLSVSLSLSLSLSQSSPINHQSSSISHQASIISKRQQQRQ